MCDAVLDTGAWLGMWWEPIRGSSELACNVSRHSSCIYRLWSTIGRVSGAAATDAARVGPPARGRARAADESGVTRRPRPLAWGPLCPCPPCALPAVPPARHSYVVPTEVSEHRQTDSHSPRPHINNILTRGLALAPTVYTTKTTSGPVLAQSDIAPLATAWSTTCARRAPSRPRG